MTTYWSGVAWIEATLAKRMEGVQDVDLVDVTERLKSFVSLPDEGLARGRSSQVDSTRDVAVNAWNPGLEGRHHVGIGDPATWGIGGLPFELNFGNLEVEGLEEHDIPMPSFM